MKRLLEIRSAVKAEPNVIPMIDIMLVLLIIFMIVTPIIANGFKATIPSAEHSQASPEDSVDVVLGLDEHGNYFLNTTPVASQDLEARLSAMYAVRNDKTMFFRADKNLEFKTVQDAVEVARRSGVRVIRAITQRDPKKSIF